jgi:hypothetical protein
VIRAAWQWYASDGIMSMAVATWKVIAAFYVIVVVFEISRSVVHK